MAPPARPKRGSDEINAARDQRRVAAKHAERRIGESARQELCTRAQQNRLHVSKRAFTRVLKEMLTSELAPPDGSRLLISPEAVSLMHWQSEEYLVQFYEEANALTCHRQAVTLHPRDTRALSKVTGRFCQ